MSNIKAVICQPSRLTSAILLASALVATAANVYIRPGSAGANIGTDWVNAHTSIPSTLIRGNTYYLADGSYGSYTIDDAASGTSLITLKKATVADHGTSTGWSDTYGDGTADFNSIRLADTSYITIDGTREYGFRVIVTGQNARGIDIAGWSNIDKTNITIKYVEIAGPGGASPVFWTQPTVGIYAAVFVHAPYDFSNLTISHCSIHGFESLLLLAKCNNLTVEYCKLYDNITSNPDPQSPHPNVAYINNCDNATFRYNEVWNWANTGWYMNNYASGNRVNHKIYGNVFRDGFEPSAPVCVYHSWGNFDGVYIYNNVAYNIGADDYFLLNYGSTITNGFAYNNIFYGKVIPNLGAVKHDFNWFSGASAHGEANGIAGGSTNPLASAPNGFTIVSTIAASHPRNKGTALGSEYSKDRNGATLGADGAWDIGAYEYAGTATPSPTASPTASPTPNTNLVFEAEAGALNLPFIAANGYLSQASETSLATGGRAVYNFEITKSGDYVIEAAVDAPSAGENSFFVNIDSEPQDPSMIWDIPPTTGLEARTVSWRGNGTWENSELIPKVFKLTSGSHQLIIKGREVNTRLDRFSIRPPPSPPLNLRMVTQ